MEGFWYVFGELELANNGVNIEQMFDVVLCWIWSCYSC